MSPRALRWIILIGTAVLVLGMIRWAMADEPVTMYVICTDSYVNVRESPSTKATVGGRVDFGWDVLVTGSTRDGSGTEWYRVDGITEQGYGYICANYLVPSKPSKVDHQTATVRASGRVAVYKRVNGARKTWAINGSKVKVKIYSDTWCLTDRGWIRTEYLEVE